MNRLISKTRLRGEDVSVCRRDQACRAGHCREFTQGV